MACPPVLAGVVTFTRGEDGATRRWWWPGGLVNVVSSPPSDSMMDECFSCNIGQNVFICQEPKVLMMQ